MTEGEWGDVKAYIIPQEDRRNEPVELHNVSGHFNTEGGWWAEGTAVEGDNVPRAASLRTEYAHLFRTAQETDAPGRITEIRPRYAGADLTQVEIRIEGVAPAPFGSPASSSVIDESPATAEGDSTSQTASSDPLPSPGSFEGDVLPEQVQRMMDVSVDLKALLERIVTTIEEEDLSTEASAFLWTLHDLAGRIQSCVALAMRDSDWPPGTSDLVSVIATGAHRLKQSGNLELVGIAVGILNIIASLSG